MGNVSLAPHMGNINIFKKASIALTLGYNLKRAANSALDVGMERPWADKVSSIVNRSLKIAKQNKTRVLPLTEYLVTLKDNLKTTI